MALISVIIPVYNAERYLKRCLESLKAQTFGDWQAVCVDDGCTDNSGKILDAFARDDRRFTVLHRENGGVSAARNEAMKYATGKYVTYVDSDDFLHPQAFEICKTVAEAENPDLIAYTYHRAYRTRTLIKNFLGLTRVSKPAFRTYDIDALTYKTTEDIYSHVTEYSHPDVPKEELRWAVKHCQPWRCMYRKETVENILFVPGIIYEDFPWWGEVLLNVRKAVILNMPLYYYYANPKSYILSSRQNFRIESLRMAIKHSENVYRSQPDARKREIWEKNFLVPFREKLAQKEKQSAAQSKKK